MKKKTFQVPILRIPCKMTIRGLSLLKLPLFFFTLKADMHTSRKPNYHFNVVSFFMTYI